MPGFQLPAVILRTRVSNGRQEVFDIVRKRFVAATPEEHVRQHVLHYLITNLGVPLSLIGVEKTITVNRLRKRCDVIVFNRNARALLLIEIKSPHVKISGDTFDQAIRYNLALSIKYLWLTNGLENFCFSLDYNNHKAVPISHIPSFDEMTG